MILCFAFFLFSSPAALSDKSGVKDVDISLEKEEAKVSYISEDITADQIATCIEEAGFDAFVKEENNPINITATSKTKNGEINMMKLNGSGDVLTIAHTTKCFLHITVSD